MDLPDLNLTTEPNYASPLMSVPPQCLIELAAEIDEVETIAARWGIPLEAMNRLLANPAIRSQLESKRVELKTTGATFRMKAEVLAEEIMLEVFHAAKDPDASKAFKLEAAKWLTKIADREPKQNAVAAGTGFSLQINIPAIGTQTATTIDVTPSTNLPELVADTSNPSNDSETNPAYYLDLPDWLKTKARDMATELGADQ